jgi:hypothetical protein
MVATAVVLSIAANTPIVGMQFLLLTLFAGILWFFPSIKNNPLMRIFVVLCFGYIMINVLISPNLIDAWRNLSQARQGSATVGTLGKTNATNTFNLTSNTPLFLNNGWWGFREITWEKNSIGDVTVRNLHKSHDDNGTSYSLVLFPRKDANDKYMLGIFDSTSKSRWVSAEKIVKMHQPENNHGGNVLTISQTSKMQRLGFKSISILPREGIDARGKIVKIARLKFPKSIKKGDKVSFHSFKWKASYIERNGQYIYFHTPTSLVLKFGSSNVALLEPVNGILPDEVWWCLEN